MKILSKKQWEKINQTIVDLQLDYNDVCEQLRLAEQQVSYLQDELRRANDIKKPIQNMATGGFVKGNSLFVEIEKQAKRGRKKKVESALFVEQKDGKYKLATEETIKNTKRGRKPRKEKEDGNK